MAAAPLVHPEVLKAEISSALKSANVDIFTQSSKPWCVLNDVAISLHSMNAASLYIMEVPQDATVSQLVEWECTVLAPLVQLVVSSHLNKKPNQERIKELESALQTVESSVLIQNSLLHPIFWSTLYPLVISTAITDLDSKFPKLTKWFQDLSSHAAYSKSVSKLFGSNPLSTLKEMLPRLPTPVYHPTSAPPQGLDAQTGPAPEEVEAAREAWDSGMATILTPRVHPLSPKKGERNLLITSALPYVNNVPHLGNIIGCVLSADVFSRFCRLRGYNSLYVCGTDEYGTATETKAVQEGITPEQICDKYNALHTEVYRWFNIDFDYFGRTTTKQQTEIAQDIFWKLYNNKCVLKDSVEQLKCETCNRFLADRFVEGTCPLCAYEDARGDQCDKCGKLINAVELVNPRCKLCKSAPVTKHSEHLFLDLPQLADKLGDYLARQYETGTWTSNSKVITKSWLRDGLKPRCITRDLKWGTPVPLEGFTDKVFYVWFDAPIGYISITANYTEKWEEWWKNPTQVEMYNFMAKDNVPFHSVVFPCTLIGADDNYTMVNHLISTEYLNYEDDKFSKSRGVGVFGNDASTTGIPADIWRFYLLYVRPEAQDSSFSWDDFKLKNNGELLNNLGNFMNRALKFVADSYAGVIPDMKLTDEDFVLIALVNVELSAYVQHLEKAQLRDGIRRILNISRLGNQYFQSTTPWKLAKSNVDVDKKRAASVVAFAANLACLLSILTEPYMPQVSETMRQQLNVTERVQLGEKFVCMLPAGHLIGKPSPLFAKIEDKLIEELKTRFVGTQTDRAAKAAELPKGHTELAKLVQQQGDKVRQLKACKAEKSVVTQEVQILLKLKQDLTKAEKAVESTSTAPSAASIVNPEEAKRLTHEVQKQGDKVRELKSSKADKSTITKEVETLIKLKRELAIAEGKNPDESTPGKGKKKK